MAGVLKGFQHTGIEMSTQACLARALPVSCPHAPCPNIPSVPNGTIPFIFHHKVTHSILFLHHFIIYYNNCIDVVILYLLWYFMLQICIIYKFSFIFLIHIIRSPFVLMYNKLTIHICNKILLIILQYAVRRECCL